MRILYRFQALTRSQWRQSKQYQAEKDCYADYVYWKMELDATMRRLGQFL